MTLSIHKSFCVYILLCKNHSYYVGYCVDLKKRFQEHIKGTHKSKYTRSFKPIKIAQSWQVETKSQAMKVEIYLKTLSHLEKQDLTVHPMKLAESFSFKIITGEHFE